MEKGVIPERAITVGYNGPTKRNVTSEGILKDTNQKLVTKVLLKEKKECMGYHKKESIYGLK